MEEDIKNQSPTVMFRGTFCTKNFVQIRLFSFYLIKLKFLISQLALTTQKKADHILEMPGLGEFCGFCFMNHTCNSRMTTKCRKKKRQRRRSSRLATVMKLGTAL